MQAPGFLDDLNAAGRAAWEAELKDALASLNARTWSICSNLPGPGQVPGLRREDQLVAADDPALSAGIASIDWKAYPIRVERCLGSAKATQAFLDRTGPSGDVGRVIGHEEYLEWRVVRNAAGAMIRFEATTETMDYWTKIAAHDPAKVLQLCGQFAGLPGPAPANAVFGPLDPFGASATPESRGTAFRATMVQTLSQTPCVSPFNNGLRAICFMSKPVNSLAAALALAAYAARPYGKKVGANTVALTGSEAIATDTQAAVDCRNSDPTIVKAVLERPRSRKPGKSGADRGAGAERRTSRAERA